MFSSIPIIIDCRLKYFDAKSLFELQSTHPSVLSHSVHVLEMPTLEKFSYELEERCSGHSGLCFFDSMFYEPPE